MVSRRSFLGSLGALGGAALAGCVTPSGPAEIVSSSVSLREGGSPREPEIVEREERSRGRRRIVIEGVVQGRNGCFDDVSMKARAEGGAITVGVNPVQSNPEQRVCTQAIVGLAYRLELVVAGGVESLTVTHGGVSSDSYELIMGETGEDNVMSGSSS